MSANESDINAALEQAHLDYEARKNDILSKLHLISDTISVTEVFNNYQDWIKQAIDFIKEKEI